MTRLHRALLLFATLGCAPSAAPPPAPAPAPAPAPEVAPEPAPAATPAGSAEAAPTAAAAGCTEQTSGQFVCPVSPDAYQAEPPPAPEPEPTVRDPRKAATAPRSRALLVTELQALERLYQATPKTSPDRVTIAHRLAEGYVELVYAAEKEPDGKKIAAAARNQALKHYLTVRSEYPTYAKLDAVYYYSGWEHERAGDLTQARAMYRELGRKFPSSPFVARVPAKLRDK